MTRSIARLVLFGAVLFAASSAGAAQSYLMTGKFAHSVVVKLDVPLIGENPGGVPNCGRTTKMSDLMIPGMTPIVQGYRTSIAATMVATPPITQTMFANPHGCLSIAGEVVATAAGAGKAFDMPTHAFSRPLPGMTVAVSTMAQANVVQFATSFKVSGPPMNVGTVTDGMGVRLPPNGTMNNGINTARFRSFHKSAWLTQTGRAGAKFTWCFGNPACTMVSQAMGVDKNGDPNIAYPVHQLIVKYTPGPNKFGGTMSHVVTAGPNPSSLAVTLGGVVQFLGLVGMGEAVAGRGYADFVNIPAMGGEAFAMFMIGPVYVPQLGSTQYLITTVMDMVPGDGKDVTAAVFKNFGFPFTTGTVTVRNTGTDTQKNPKVQTLTGMGGDAITAMGARNISLVAGSVLGCDQIGSEDPGLVQMFLPEPGSPVQLAAGAIVLLALARWRPARLRLAARKSDRLAGSATAASTRPLPRLCAG